MKKFQRTKEDFICANCGFFVRGSGYTNHCPKCLWSKHVDIHPGDRSAECGGLMKPIALEKKGEKYSILHQCVVCGIERKNKVSEEDDFESILALLKGSKNEK